MFARCGWKKKESKALLKTIHIKNEKKSRHRQKEINSLFSQRINSFQMVFNLTSEKKKNKAKGKSEKEKQKKTHHKKNANVIQHSSVNLYIRNIQKICPYFIQYGYHEFCVEIVSLACIF